MTTSFLHTDDGLISARYIVRLDHLDPNEPWFITYARGTRCIDTRASAKAVTEFLSNTQSVLVKQRDLT